MAKSLGAGFPIGAFWIRDPYADLLSAGTHGSTYGGSPLSCAVALKVLEVIQREKLAENVRRVGEHLKSGLARIATAYPQVIRSARGLGFMLGIELAPNIAKLPADASRTQAARFAQLLHSAGVLMIPAGAQVLRLLPPLNLSQNEAEEGLSVLENIAARVAE
jgi:acetylornithine aminotransferase/acetylornithine/N-succinyldiaminopimelate aminotransferase